MIRASANGCHAREVDFRETMSLSNKPLNLIDELDLRALVTDQVREGRTIEYKQALPGTSDSEKKEFLADVSSFGNAAGGDLILGISESAGIPIDVCGCAIADVDAEVLRLDSILRTGIDPRIPGVSIRDVALENGQTAILIRIPKSWASPHMIIFKDWRRFYSRTSAGKYMLDVPELRAAFVLSETTSERIRQFRIDRLSKLAADEGPVLLGESGKMILHIIPITAFDPSALYNVSGLANDTTGLHPLFKYVTGWSHRHNFDGYLTYAMSSVTKAAESYLQVFRNGIIEAVDACILDEYDGRREIPSKLFEEEIIESLPKYLSTQQRLGVEPPLLIMVSFLRVKGGQIRPNNSYRFAGHPIDRDALLIPEVLLDRYEADFAAVMRPAFDAVWNAAGWPRSMNYDDNGVRLG